MNGRGECCIARYAGGAYDISKVDRIMLRFRPIAPKPPSTDGSFSVAAATATATATATTPEGSEPCVKTNGRKKRRSSKDGNNNNNNNCSLNKRCGGRKRKSSPEETTSVVKTLPLLPETPDVKESLKGGAKMGFPMWLSSGNEYDNGGDHVISHGTGHVLEDPTAAVGRRAVVVSWVKVESVTDKWVVDSYGYDDIGLGRTDQEKVMSLELDPCPGFVSDSVNRVRWTNAAYKRMVAAEETKEVVVRVVVEEGVEVPLNRAAFSCRVRVITCGKEKNYLTLPSDVWRMNAGGFAWRLDTKAALSLGW